VTTINKSAANLLGVTIEEVLGARLEDVLVGSLSDLLISIRQVLEARGKETIFKYLNVAGKEARPLSLLVTITPLYDLEDRYLGLVLVLDDISHLIKAQREVAWREVARRIAHEIKNPLTPIKLSAQRLQKRYLGKLDENEIFKECTDTIISQVDELKQMVNEFSQFARFPAANPLPNELNSALAEVVGLFRQAHRNVTFEFLPDANVPVFSFDRDQIKRVVLNLVDNAVAAMTFTPISAPDLGVVQVITEFKQAAGLVVIQVSDSGPGIPEEVQPMLFEPYFSTKKEGTGLGLAIAKRIVNDHDGYIRVRSGFTAATEELPNRRDGKFTTCFIIELPVNRTTEVIQYGP
jgi:two-component system nitrogen regulation sensor histidine kinase NtrY